MHIQQYSYTYKNVAQIQKSNFKQHISSQFTFCTQQIEAKHEEGIDLWRCRGKRFVIFTSRLRRFYASMLYQREA